MANLVVSVAANDGVSTDIYTKQKFPVVVSVENHGAADINLLGVNLVCSDKRLVLPTFGVVPSGAVSQGSSDLDTNCWVVAAGETGSYRGDVLTNYLVSPLESNTSPIVFSINAMVQPNEGQGALVSGSVTGSFVTASSPFLLTLNNAPYLEKVVNLGVPIVWSQFDNKRNIATNYDFAAQTYFYARSPFNAFGNTTSPPQEDLPGTTWSSSAPSVAEVVESGSYRANWTTSASVGNSFIVGGGGAVTIKGVGTAIIYNQIDGAVTGSLTLKVVEALPVALRIVPSVASANPNTLNNITTPALQFRAQVKYTDSDWTDVSSGAYTSWSSSNTKAFTINSAGLATRVVGSLQGDQSTISVVYNNTTTGRPARLEANAVAVVGG